MFKKIMPILSILALAGCGTQWGHPSASQSDFQRDAAQCNLYSQQSNPSQQAANNPYLDNMQRAQQNIQQGGANLGIAINRMNAYDNCMAAKGYYKAN
jgi:hypothetical protein